MYAHRFPFFAICVENTCNTLGRNLVAQILSRGMEKHTIEELKYCPTGHVEVTVVLE